MLKKVLKLNLRVISSIVIGLILVQLISAYFFGIIAEKQFDYQFKRLTATDLVTVKKNYYSRGWFTSTNYVTLDVNPKIINKFMNILPGGKTESSVKLTTLSKETYQIRYTTHVTHGVFAGWIHGNILPTYAYATTNIELPNKLKAILNKFFNNQTPLLINNILYLNKSGKYYIDSPPFNYDEALSDVKVNWGGLNAKVSYNQMFNKFDTTLNIPLFEMVAPTQANLSINDLNYYSNSSYSLNDIKVGISDLKLGSVKVELKDTHRIQLKFGEIVHLLTGVNSADFLNDIDAVDPNNFIIQKVNYHSISSDESNFFNATAKVSFDKLITNNKNYGPMSFDLAISHVYSPEFGKLLDNLESMATAKSDDPEFRNKTIALLKTYLTPIFIQSPIIDLKEFSLTTPDGILNLSGHASTHDFQAVDMNNQTTFMKKLNLNIEFSIPKPILASLFVLQLKYFLTAGNAQLDKQSSDALNKVVNILLDNQLHVWLKKGYIKQNGNAISSKITMESGVMSLNGIDTR